VLAREYERGKKRGGGAAAMGHPLYVTRWGWGTGHGWHNAAARRGGRGASAAVGRHGVAGSGPAVALVGGALTGAARPVPK
jgi:hypothetical protein